MFRYLLIICAFCYFSCSVSAAEISVNAIALFNDRAMLSINGGKAKIVRAGSEYKGVKLVSSDTTEAVIELDGKRETLTLNSGALLSQSLGTQPLESYKTTLDLFVDKQGFFQSSGQVNGRAINFLVDTGANIVVLNSLDASRIGLEYLNGRQTYAATASGTAPMYTVTLDSISIGGIELKDVDAGVIVGSFPQIPLLGMTFLRGVDMNRTGDTMRLTKR